MHEISTAVPAAAEQFWDRALLRLSLIEMWERFSYYTMFSLLALFLVANVSDGGFGWPEAEALRFFGVYLGLVQFTPLLGGLVTDRWLGNQRALFMGALLMTGGHFLMAAPHVLTLLEGRPVHTTVLTAAATAGGGMELAFKLALLLLAVGNGLFKPNISALIARLPHRSASERDAAFATFYMYINVGALLAGLACGYIAQRFGFHWAFATAGLAMLLALLMMRILGPAYIAPLSDLPQPAPPAAAAARWDGHASTTTGPLLVVLAFALAFVIANYQLAGLVSVFTSQHVDRSLFGFSVPSAWFLSLNPLAIVLMTPILARWWRSKKSALIVAGTAQRFAVGFLLVSASFLLLSGAASQAQDRALASPLWIIAWVLVMTLGELLIGPVGTASISRLAPTHRQALAMGALSAALGLGGWLSGKVGAASSQFESQTVYTLISAGALICSVTAWTLRNWLRRRGA